MKNYDDENGVCQCPECVKARKSEPSPVLSDSAGWVSGEDINYLEGVLLYYRPDLVCQKNTGSSCVCRDCFRDYVSSLKKPNSVLGEKQGEREADVSKNAGIFDECDETGEEAGV
jgi:hypothetical protein